MFHGEQINVDFATVCSGIEAPSVALEKHGWRAQWFAEIEAFPSAVLSHHWPEVPNLGDMTLIPRQVLSGSVSAPSVLIGGTPCQAFSVAGMREGLSDPRGELTIKFVELADAIDHVRAGRGDPTAVVWWENVPGVLSDRENAFGCFIGALVGESCELQPPGGKWKNAGCVYGPKRAAAWRVLDAQYFGVAQRRRRVFVVASARDGFDPAAVLFESEGVRRDTPPSREAGEGFAADVATSLTASGRGVERVGETRGQDPVVAVTCMAHGQGGAEVAENRSPTLTCNHEAPIVCHGTQDPCVSGVDFALGRNSGQENAICFVQNSRSEVRKVGDDGQITGALAAEPGAQQQSYIAQSVALRGREGGATAELGGPVAGTLRASTQEMGRPSHDQDQSAHTRLEVRRLTPKEAERLQGFPDNHTDIAPWYACGCGCQFPEQLGKYGCPNCCGEHTGRLKKVADGPRHKAIGNSMAVPVIEWIGLRIQKVLAE